MFPTELRIFYERPKPKTFIEYIIDRIINGRNINLEKKEAFVMLERLQEKKVQLNAKLEAIGGSHEEEIKVKVAEFEAKIREEFEFADKVEREKVINQLEIVEELITEETNRANEALADQSTDTEITEPVTENYDPTNEISVEGE